MSIFNIISLLGGLALFLYGMSVMEHGLERASGGRLERTLEKMSGNIFKAIFFGAVVTAAIQSSSATTVICVGLVNAKILSLRRAIGIIMGANIGTTITAHLLRLMALDSSNNLILQFLKPTTLAPLAAIIGIIIYYTSKKVARRDFGLILVGFGILFTGMFNMEAAVAPLQTHPGFAEAFATFENPVMGVLLGAGVTALIQSSAASIGILQAMTVTGAITYSTALPIIMGQNIGTCITPVLASIGASKNAKRTALVHVAFNTIGTIVFLVGIYTFQYTIGFSQWSDAIGRGEIANFHTIFNVAVTVLFIPFTGALEKLSKILIKPGKDDFDGDDDASILDERFLGYPGYAITQAREAVVKMAHYALGNYRRSVELLAKFDKKKHERSTEVENLIDRMQSKVDAYLLRLTQNELTESENTNLSEVLQVVNEFERIGDLAENICDSAVQISETGTYFSESAVHELEILTEAVDEIVSLAVDGYERRDVDLVSNVEPLEEVIDILVETLKVRHSDRLREGLCSVDNAFHFVEILYNLERIADHCSNVGVHVISYAGTGAVQDRHEFLRDLRSAKTPEYRAKVETYDKKYYERIKGIEELS